MKTYDYINRVVLTLPLTVYEGPWTHSPLSLLCITMILRVRRNFFEITTFPNMMINPSRTQTSQVSHSSPSAPPLSRLPHLRVVPVWGLAVVHRLGVLGAAWSTYESHRKRTVRGEPDGWDPRGPWSHARKVPPYYALYVHCTWEGLMYFVKKSSPR